MKWLSFNGWLIAATAWVIFMSIALLVSEWGARNVPVIP